VEVYLSDENGKAKHVGNDKRYLLEVRPGGAFTEYAVTPGQLYRRRRQNAVQVKFCTCAN
jgi:hypothetical protein